MIQATDETFVSLVQDSDLPVVVFFTAPWCEPCQKIKPQVKQVSQTLSREVRLLSVDVSTCPRTLDEILHKAGVRKIPTFFLFLKPGQGTLDKPNHLHTGPLTKRQLEDWITARLIQSGEQT